MITSEWSAEKSSVNCLMGKALAVESIDGANINFVNEVDLSK